MEYLEAKQEMLLYNIKEAVDFLLMVLLDATLGVLFKKM